jgi:hypothetical protein
MPNVKFKMRLPGGTTLPAEQFSIGSAVAESNSKQKFHSAD